MADISKITDINGDEYNIKDAAARDALDGKADASHTHGNITNAGALQSSDITIASGDKLVVTDSSNSNKVARTSVAFDGSTTTKCLTQKGTWASFTNNAGTITGVSANGTSVATSGVADIPAASTSAYGVTKLSNSTSSTSTVLAATANAVKTVYDLAATKADDDAVVKLTGTQTAAGSKTWTGACYIKNSAESPAIQFRSTPQTSSTGIIYYMGTSDSDASTDYTQGRFYFYEYSPASDGKSRTSYYERYRLPAVNKARSDNGTYDILTTKGPAFLQLKEYSYAYTVAGSSSLEITNTNFGHSSPSGYTPVALVRYNTGSTQVTVPHVGINIASNTIAFVVQNTKSSSVSATAKIAILYARTTAIV